MQASGAEIEPTDERAALIGASQLLRSMGVFPTVDAVDFYAQRDHEKVTGGEAAAAPPAQPHADGGSARRTDFARTVAPHGAAPPHAATIQALSYALNP